METEIWKDIEGFEGKYQVSSLGSIKSLDWDKTKKARIMKPYTDRFGTLAITLMKNNKRYRFQLGRLIYETFTGQKLIRNKDVVMYKDENKKNCALSNLYVVDRSEWQKALRDTGLMKTNKYEYNGQELSLRQIAELNNNLVSSRNMQNRLRYGWNIYETAEIPVAVSFKQKGRWKQK